MAKDPRKRPRTITITGMWTLTDDELEEKVDHAFHEAELCACGHPEQGYVLSVRAIDPTQPDNRA